MDIKGKKVIVTGGAAGIGQSIVEKLLNKNAIVGVFNKPNKSFTKSNSRSNVYHYICDVSKPDQVRMAVNKFFNEFGSIDVLINNAAVLKDQPLISISSKGLQKHKISLWKKILDTNLSSVFYMTSNVVEKMFLKKTKGIIINVSSISSTGNSGQTAYSAAKAGVNALTKTWSKELNYLGIRVAGISPGFTKTKMILDGNKKKYVDEWIKKVPLKRLAEPSEIADGVIFIIQNDYFHGKILEIDGGITL